MIESEIESIKRALSKTFECDIEGFFEAYQILSDCKDKYHDAESYNNLGVYINQYCDCLPETVNTSKRRAAYYLKSACRIKKNLHSLLELADLYFESKKYKYSLSYYLDALEYVGERKDILPFIYNNIAVNYYHLEQYKEASIYFFKANDNKDIIEDNEVKIQIAEALVFALLKSGNTEKAQNAMRELLQIEDYFISPNTVVLNYLTGIIPDMNEMFSEYEQYYDLNDNWCKYAKMILKKRDVKRETVLKNHLYIPQKVFICNFYACDRHSNPCEINN